jgi:hypothetical protein
MLLSEIPYAQMETVIILSQGVQAAYKASFKTSYISMQISALHGRTHFHT